MSETLVGEYKLQEVPFSVAVSHFQELHAEVFPSTVDFNVEAVLSEQERAGIQQYREWTAQSFRLGHIILLGDAVVGWSFGWQLSADSYYMTNTGILPAHQGQGLYRAMLPKIVERLKQAGFQRIKSSHHLTNNAVLVPKLKAGFVITGFEMRERFGSLVNLTYYTNPTRREAVAFRVGEKRLSPALREHFALFEDEKD